jgi:hypothetical protein
MTRPRTTTLDILKHLNKSNCKECGLPTCMAFAAMVSQGQKKITDCPYLSPEIAAQLATEPGDAGAGDFDPEEALAPLKDKIREMDFESSAARLGASVVADRLGIRCLGRVFEVDKSGLLHAMCHTNFWLHVPLLDYAIHCEGARPTGDWASFHELKHAKEWSRFFSHRCEKVLQQMAEEDTQLYLDMLELFASGETAGEFTADRTFILYPLPRVPFLYSFWKGEDQFPPKTTILFDRSVERNLGAESIFRLSTGIVEMFKRILSRHGSVRD